MSASFMTSIKFSDMSFPIEMISHTHDIVAAIDEALNESVITSDEVDTVVDITIIKLNK